MSATDLPVVLVTFMIYRPLECSIFLAKPRLVCNWSDLFGDEYDYRINLLDRLFLTRWVPPITLTLLSLGAYQGMKWPSIDPTQTLRLFIGFASGLPAWKSATYDVDLATGKQFLPERCVVVLAAIGVIAYPGLLILLLFAAVNYF